MDKPNLLSRQEILSLIPQRKTDANKGDFGHILIVGGDDGMGGSVVMAAESAYRAGAGRVTVLTHEKHFSALISRLPSAMTKSADSTKELQKIIQDKTVIAIGCGLGKSAWSKKMFEFFMKTDLPKVIDADALNLLSESKIKYDLQNAILTPHPGEAGRLLNCDTKWIQENRELAIQKLQQKYQANIVLKGSGSLVLITDQKLYQCQFGNAGMAVAGMGDVLTGIIAGLVAQNISLNQAAILGVNIHALAGDLVKEKQGEIGILPTDLIKQIPTIIND
jgi:hydroxyethylthiazole kinase-like uncharacterized protein yjeF